MRLRALFVLLACSGCGLDLKDYKVAFACDRNGGDGGRQCNAGWSCGYDDKCFPLALNPDAGEVAADWQCANATHCPTGWKCGPVIDEKAFCVHVGAGAPSRCRLDAGTDCEGGWRCGVSGRCFDPSITTAGAETACTDDLQCPDGFRCGQAATDGGARLCIARGVGAASTCQDDLGCEGGWRCDTEQRVCRLVPDVVDPGDGGLVDAVLVSPKQALPVPLRFAATRKAVMPPAAFGGLVQNPQIGVVTAALHDGGVLISAQVQDSLAPGRELIQSWLPLPPATRALDVQDLVISERGPVVRFGDAGVVLLPFAGNDGGLWPGPSRLIRAIDAFPRSNGWWAQGVASISGVPQQSADGGRATRVDLLISGQSQIFPGEVFDVVVRGHDVYALGTDGVFAWTWADPQPMNGGPPMPFDAGVRRLSMPLPRVDAWETVAGRPENTAGLGFQVVVDRGDGGRGLLSLSTNGPGSEQLDYVFTRDGGVSLDACPAQPLSTLRQVAMTEGEQSGSGRAASLNRCEASADGGSFAVTLRYDTQGNASGATIGARFSPAVDDPQPWRRPFVTQRGSAFVRAHAGAEGRMWVALDESVFEDLPRGFSLLGDAPLRPMVLDRQPDTLVSFSDGQRARTYCVADGNLYAGDEQVGFVSNFNGTGQITPLSLVSGHPGWVITTNGVFNLGLAAATNGEPTLFVRAPAGVTFSAPVSGVAQVLNGRQVLLVAAGDTIWAADVTDSAEQVFGPLATFAPVLVPTPGIRVRSITLENGATDQLVGYLTTNTQTLKFSTSDLVRWAVTSLAQPTQSLPLEVWTDGKGRVGTADGRVWSLPIMVELTQPLPPDAGAALDFARKCGRLYVTSPTGVYTIAPAPDGGLPRWVPAQAVNAQLDGAFEALRLYETAGAGEQLHVATTGGRVVEVAPSVTCP